jgi:hypothetical protein
MRGFVRASFGGQRGLGATEYVILLVVAVVAIIAVVSRFGKTLGGHMEATGKSVQMLGEDQSGHIVERKSAPVLGEDQNGHIVERSVLPDPIDKPYDKGIDTRFFILLGFGGLVVILILMAFAKRRQKDGRLSPEPELRNDKTARYTRRTGSPPSSV